MESKLLRDHLIYTMSERSNFSEHTKKINDRYAEECHEAIVRLTDKVSEEFSSLILDVRILDQRRFTYTISHPLFHNFSYSILSDHLDIRSGKNLVHLSFSNLVCYEQSVSATFLIWGNKDYPIYLKPLFEEYPKYHQVRK